MKDYCTNSIFLGNREEKWLVVISLDLPQRLLNGEAQTELAPVHPCVKHPYTMKLKPVHQNQCIRTSLNIRAPMLNKPIHQHSNTQTSLHIRTPSTAACSPVSKKIFCCDGIWQKRANRALCDACYRRSVRFDPCVGYPRRKRLE